MLKMDVWTPIGLRRLHCWLAGQGKCLKSLVDLVRFELTTSSMPWKRAPNCATGPRTLFLQCTVARQRRSTPPYLRRSSVPMPGMPCPLPAAAFSSAGESTATDPGIRGSRLRARSSGTLCVHGRCRAVNASGAFYFRLFHAIV